MSHLCQSLSLVVTKCLIQPGDRGHPTRLDEKTYKPLTLGANPSDRRWASSPGAAEDGFWRSAMKRWVDKRRFRCLCFLLCNMGLTIPAFPAFLCRKAASSARYKHPTTEPPPSPFLLFFSFFFSSSLPLPYLPLSSRENTMIYCLEYCYNSEHPVVSSGCTGSGHQDPCFQTVLFRGCIVAQEKKKKAVKIYCC